jgi:hypothetical protein
MAIFPAAVQQPGEMRHDNARRVCESRFNPRRIRLAVPVNRQNGGLRNAR